MPHYYTKDNDRLESEKHPVRFVVKDHPFQLLTDNGVFSKSGLDFGSRVLLESLSFIKGDKILDLGCGYGPIGITLSVLYETVVTMVDINDRAVSLSKENAKLNKVDVTVLQSDGFEQVHGLFDAIISNPPIRAGKKVFYAWFAQAGQFLTPEGRFFIVINKNQGALSAIAELERHFTQVVVIERKSGYHVISCQK